MVGAFLNLCVLSCTLSWAEGLGYGQGKPSDRVGAKTYTSLGIEDEPRYEYGFKHFKYANPDAPKGGVLRLGSHYRDFASMNPALARGTPAPGADWMFDSLLTRAADDPNAMYPRLAKSFVVADDCSYVIFNINMNAKWNNPGVDGCKPSSSGKDERKPVTADDIAFSYDANKKFGNAGASGAFSGVNSYELVDDRRILFRLNPKECTTAIMALGEMTIFSKAHHAQKGREFETVSMVPPQGSGPYVLERVDQSRGQVVYKRVCNYWGAEEPYAKGRYNFDRLSFQTFGDQLGHANAFNRGQLDYRPEYDANQWPPDPRIFKATYDDMSKNKVSMHEVQFAGPQGYQGIGFNSESGPFADRQVRKALALLFDKEYVADQLRSGNAKPVNNYFPGVDLNLTPEGEKKANALLKELKAKYSAKGSVFPDEALTNLKPESVDRKDYAQLNHERKELARKIMEGAGWKLVKDPDNSSKMVWMKGGERFPLVRMVSDDAEREVHYTRRLRDFGLDVDHIRVNDGSSYRWRLDKGEYDLATRYVYWGTTPSGRLMRYLSSEAAKDPVNSMNSTRTKSPVVDDLIHRVLESKPGEDRKVALNALDRVLRAESVMALTTQDKSTRFLIRNRFGRSYEIPSKGSSDLTNIAMDSWWQIEPPETK